MILGLRTYPRFFLIKMSAKDSPSQLLFRSIWSGKIKKSREGVEITPRLDEGLKTESAFSLILNYAMPRLNELRHWGKIYRESSKHMKHLLFIYNKCTKIRFICSLNILNIFLIRVTNHSGTPCIDLQSLAWAFCSSLVPSGPKCVSARSEGELLTSRETPLVSIYRPNSKAKQSHMSQIVLFPIPFVEIKNIQLLFCDQVRPTMSLSAHGLLWKFERLQAAILIFMQIAHRPTA